MIAKPDPHRVEAIEAHCRNMRMAAYILSGFHGLLGVYVLICFWSVHPILAISSALFCFILSIVYWKDRRKWD